MTLTQEFPFIKQEIDWLELELLSMQPEVGDYGDFLARVLGIGREPGDTRLYQPDDDYRRIDWNATARTPGEAIVRVPIADMTVDGWLVIDLAPSMYFGTSQRELADQAVLAAAAFGLLIGRHGNRLGAILQRGPGQSEVILPSGQRGYELLPAYRAIANRTADGHPPSLAEALGAYVELQRQSGLCVVFSHFRHAGNWQDPLQQVSLLGHELATVTVNDRRLDQLEDVGTLAIKDPETGPGREMVVETSGPRGQANRVKYADYAREQTRKIQQTMTAAGADQLVIDTDWDTRRLLSELVRWSFQRKTTRR